MRLLALALFAVAVAFTTPAGSRAGPAGAASCAAALQRTASATVQLSEVEADPVLGGTDTADEWFELANQSSATVTLTGWSVADAAASDQLPQVTLGPGRCMVLAATSAGFLAEHAGHAQPFATIADGAIGNGLANGGDVLTLLDAGGAVVDCVAWGTATGCFAPAVAATVANTSSTLQRASAQDTDTAADWSAAAETPCSVAATAVRVASFRASALGSGAVRLTWRAPLATAVLGFRVWRSAGSGYARISRRLLRARPSGAYRFVDRHAGRSGRLHYRLQALLLDGRSEWFGPVRVR